MKKLAIILGAATLLFASCNKSGDKCKCTVESNLMKPQDVVINRPENKACHDIKATDNFKINVGGIDIQLGGLNKDNVKISCKTAPAE